jgi:hypothetical protein
MTPDLTQLNEALKIMHDLTAHSLSIWNFYWIVCLAVLGFTLTDKGGHLQHPLARILLSVGFLAFAIGNGYVLHRAAVRHEMSHRLLESVSPGPMKAQSDPAAAEKARVQLQTRQQIATIARQTRPSTACEVLWMHIGLSVIILSLIWIVPWIRARYPESAASPAPAKKPRRLQRPRHRFR